MLSSGIGIEKDEHQILIWYKKSANESKYNGINYVGYCYEHGIGVKKDEYKAFAHYQNSVGMDNSNKYFMLAFVIIMRSELN